MFSRSEIAERFGSSFSDKRKVLKELGRAESIDPAAYRARYRRGGIARRLVRIFPAWTWRGNNTFLLDGSENPNLDLVVQRFGVRKLLLAVDILAELTGYAGIVMDGDGGPLSAPPGGPVSSISVWGADCLHIDGYDPTGAVRQYKLVRTNMTDERIHPDRVIHYANGDLDSSLHGEPVLEPAWDVLDDIEKIYGSAAESIWQTAIPDLHADTPIQEGLAAPDPDDVADFDQQFQNYHHRLNRVIRTFGGTTVSKIAGAAPSGIESVVDTGIMLLSATYGIPKRILSGSERGELASTQDRLNWQETIDERRNEIAVRLAHIVIHGLAAAAGIELTTTVGEGDLEQRVETPITVAWETWSTNRTPVEETQWLTGWSNAVTTAADRGIIAVETAVQMLPEEWFGPPDERLAPLDGEDPLSGDGASTSASDDEE